jgi:glycosyltransferase A (GT-A) superfamily protein (DUF2064 family)
MGAWRSNKFSRLSCIPLEISDEGKVANLVSRKAVLIFAHPIGLDLSRRGLPNFLRALLDLRALVSGNVDADFHLFTSGTAPTLSGVSLHRQRGATFAERLEAAMEEIAALGYREVVLVGRDCPLLEAGDIARAFAELATNRLVLGPDHRGGCYLIALRASDRHLLRGIRWKRDTDCGQLQRRCGNGEVALLPIKQDIDSWRDLHLLAQSADVCGRLVVVFLDELLSLGKSTADFFVDSAEQAERVRQQLPPPAFAR